MAYTDLAVNQTATITLDADDYVRVIGNGSVLQATVSRSGLSDVVLDFGPSPFRSTIGPYGVSATVVLLSRAGTSQFEDSDLEVRRQIVPGLADFMYSPLGICEPQSAFNNANKTLLWSDAGTYIGNGTNPVTYTLPTLDAAQLAARFRIVNAGTSTIAVNTAGGALFNLVAAKTSYSLAANQWINCEAARSSAGTLFWAVTATNGT